MTPDYCKLADAHKFSTKTQNAMTAKEKRQEVRHNQLGAELCGWKP